ncbi:MAG: hypothetical protein R3C18_19255 [Planctomycetaceae bacterium]
MLRRLAIILTTLTGCAGLLVAQDATPPRFSAGKDDVPDYHLTHVEIEGEVLQDRASLIIRVGVSVNRGENLHDVELRMGQAHVWKREYIGPGEIAPYTSTKTDDGMTWRVRGIGKHELIFHAWVPVKRISGGGQILLSLPKLPPHFESNVKLRIPQAPLEIRAPKDTTTILEQVDEDGTTSVHASIAEPATGGGSRLDLSWFTTVTMSGDVQRVTSNWAVTPRTSSVSAIVDQELTFDSGRVSEIRVKAPSQLSVSEVTGLHVENWLIDETRPGWIIVHLNMGQSSRTRLRWILEGEAPPGNRALQIDGLDVEFSGQQSGTIEVELANDLQLVADLDASQFVGRTMSGNDGSSGRPKLQFNYSRQPFRLQLLSVPVVLVTTTKPSYDLYVDQDETLLEFTLDINVETGVLRQLALQLPEQEYDWQGLTLVDAAGATLSLPESGRDRALVTWKVPQSRHVLLRGRATAPSKVDQLTSWPVQLPIPDSTYLLTPVVSLRSADEIELTVDSENSPLEALPKLDERENLAAVYRLRNLTEPILVTAQPHARELSARATLDVNSIDEAAIHITQYSVLNVRYGRLSTIELLVPPELKSQIPDFGITEVAHIRYRGKRLPAAMTPNGIRVPLPEPTIGEIPLEIQYRLPLPESSSANVIDVDVPVFALADVEYSELQCHITPIDQAQVDSSDDWGAVVTSPDGALWVAKNAQSSSVPISVSSDFGQVSQQYVVNRALIRTQFAANGLSETSVAYEILSPPSYVVLQLPEDCGRDQVHDIRLNGVAAPPGQVVFESGERLGLRIYLGDAPPENVQLQLTYVSRTPQPFGLTRSHRVEFPSFPKSVWVNETDWELQLPLGQHLFAYPKALFPHFTWTRTGFIWQRRLTPGYQQRSTESSSDQPPAYFYAFRAIGPLPEVSIRSMSQSMILFVGAGTSLLLGFMFWRFPHTRNVLTIVALAFCMSVVSMWFLEAIQLLLQPALVGLALAGIATFVDSRFRRRQPPVPRHRTGGSSIIRPPRPNGDSSLPPQIGSESATRVPSTVYRPEN